MAGWVMCSIFEEKDDDLKMAVMGCVDEGGVCHYPFILNATDSDS